MENPASWGKLERVIHDALREYDAEQERGVIGASRAAVVATALRREGLVQEEASRNSASGSGAVNSEVLDGVLYPDRTWRAVVRKLVRFL